MTQNKTIIQSGNNSLRAYELEGVVTPASGLEEWVRLSANLPRPNLSWGEFNFQAFGLSFPIRLKRVTISFFDVPDANGILDLSVNWSKLGINTADIIQNKNSAVMMIQDEVITNKDNLKFTIDDPVNGTLQFIEFLGYRVSLQNLGDGVGFA